jgi:tetratricopeptide (TPR) repeat protein
MNAKALILALVAATVTACASAGGGETEATGPSPRENEATRAASVHLVQAGLAEGEEAEALFQEALTDALTAVEQMPDNPKSYLVAGQAAAGLHQWVRADTMFQRAVDLYPEYEEQIVVEREQAWADAYNMGAEALNQGDLDRALAMFEGADRLYQGRPEAKLALGSVYVNRGNTEAAAEAYLGALEVLSGEPPAEMTEEQAASWAESRRVAAFNAAQLLAQTGDFERAAQTLQSFLDQYEAGLDAETALQARTALAGFLAQAGDAEAAEAMYEEILNRTDLTANEYFQAGIGFFNTSDYARAAEAFSAAAELNPYSRDAYLNLVQALYSQALELEEMEETPERNEELEALYRRILDAADEVRELDPLNRNVVSFMLRAYRSLADLAEQGEAQQLTERTQELFREYQNQSFDISDIQIAIQGDDTARVTGSLGNLAASAGEPVVLRFELLDEQGQIIDDATVTVTTPEQGAATQFSAILDVPGGEFAGWRYEVTN